jgi:DNA (cytosine-5)-methyltransferase 1
MRKPAVPSYRGHALRLARHPDAPDPSDLAAVRHWAETADRPRAIDLFCGAGGLSLGLHDAGFKVLVGADSNSWAVETHTGNLGGLGYVGDLSDPTELLEQLAGWGIDHVELVAGGVPCQPFSRAGQAKLRELIRSGDRHPQDPRAALWKSFMEVVAQLEPEAVLVENVPDLPVWDEGAVLSGFLESLGELGYRVDARIMETYRFGVPQHRARLILVGLRGNRQMDWPTATDDLVTVRDAIGDLPPVPGGQRREQLPYRSRPGQNSPFRRRMRRGLDDEGSRWIHDHITRSVRADDWEAYTGLAEGQTYADMPAHLQRYRTDIFTDKYKRLSWGELSRTITAHIAKDGYWYIHPEQHRTLSIREAARLQTFPDWFRFAGQPSHRYAQIGNAVPPFLGEVIGNAVQTALRQPAEDPTSSKIVRRQLIDWNSRQPQHPWRRPGTNPWLVMVGELALDRPTTVSAAQYEAVCSVAPSPAALHESTGAIERLMSVGLTPHGSRLVHEAASTIVELFDGAVPSDDLALRLIPGVGDSVAKSVTCFGRGHRSILFHAAAARVATRVVGKEHRRRWQLRLDLHGLAGPEGPDAEFNAAVLQLGSTLCRSTEPLCGECPIRTACSTGLESRAAHLTLLEAAA